MSAFIQAENLELFTPAGRALAHPLNFNIQAGEMLLIEGPNGAGKSTLLKTLLGLHSRFEGSLRKTISPEQIAYLPQLGNVQFFLPMNLRDVIHLEGAPEDADIERLNLLDANQLETPWNSGSGGERQKALLCRVLLSPAKLFVLDEPLNHLDQKGRESIQTSIQRLLTEGKSLVVVSHGTHWPTDKIHRLKLEVRAP